MQPNGLKIGLSLAALMATAAPLQLEVTPGGGVEIASSQAWAQTKGADPCVKSKVQESTSTETDVYAGYSKHEVNEAPGSPGTSTVTTTTTTARPAAAGCEPVGTRTESAYTDGPGQSPFQNKDSTCEATGTLACPD